MTAPAQLIEGRRVAAMIERARRDALEEAATMLRARAYAALNPTKEGTAMAGEWYAAADAVRALAARPEETR